QAGQRAQLVDVVWIRQEAHIEGQVGVGGRTVLEAEGEDGQCELVLLRVPANQLRCDATSQRAAGQRGRIDDDVRALPERREQLALLADPVDDAAAACQRMPPAGLLVAVK